MNISGPFFLLFLVLMQNFQTDINKYIRQRTAGHMAHGAWDVMAEAGGRGRGRGGSLTCGHDPRGGDRHDGDVLGGVRLVQVPPHHAQRSAAVPAGSSGTSLLLGDHPHPGPRLHRAGDGEHGGGVVGGGGGGRRGVREGGRAGLLRAQLLLGLVQEHGVLDLDRR